MRYMMKQKFRVYRLDEEKKNDQRKKLAISLNKQEEAWLEELKQDLNIKSDGTALKTGAFIGKNIIRSTFGKQLCGYLFKKNRAKYEDFQFKNFK